LRSCPRKITTSRFRKQIIAWRRDYGSYGHSFRLNRDSRGSGGKDAAQEAPSAAGQTLQPDAGGEEAAVKRVVDGIMQPYLAQEQRTAGGHLWRRSPYLGAIVAVSLHGHRYFFTYGKATDAGAPFTRETLVEIGSCTKTFTTTLFARAINRNQIVPDASAQKYMPNGYTLRGSN
jgi:CubicO group peptidase (beta-lactamase class C family)